MHNSCINLELFKNNLIELIEDLVEIKNLKFIYEIDSSLPMYFITDSERLQQIILNLINNSIKFTENGQIKLKICSE